MLLWFLLGLACVVLAIPTGGKALGTYLIALGSVNLVAQGYVMLAKAYSIRTGVANGAGSANSIIRTLPVQSAQLTIFKWRKQRGYMITCTVITTAMRVLLSYLDAGAIDVWDILVPVGILLGLPAIGFALALIPYSEV